MNTVAAPPVPWPRRLWFYAISGVFLLQIGLVWQLAQRPQRPAERPIFRTTIQLSGDPEVLRRLSESTVMPDPTLLALPSLDGFSGPAWLRFPTLDFQPSERVDTTHALALDTQSLTATFSQFLATNVIAAPIIADKPLPPIPRFEPNFPFERPPTQTLARIEGALAARPLISGVELKSWPAAEILSNTVVQAAVDALGFTFSTTLLSGSGSTNADQHALTQAYNARFRPARPGTGATFDPARSLTWGRWIFQWHTVPLPATNVATATP